MRIERREMARVMGRRGGEARARRLGPEERRRIAALGAAARRRSLEAGRRIADNLRYAEAVRDLRGGGAAVVRSNRVTERLPGIYADRS